MSAGDEVRSGITDLLQQWSGAGRIYVGYSGGMDSSVLLHAASRVKPDAVVALHVNHGLQLDADRWQAHCQAQCMQWDVPLRSHRAVVSRRGNLEAAARAARYDFFSSQVGVGDVLLLAHHRDDQAETLLLRLFQGRGFYGMPKHRRLRADAGLLLRPLLGLPQRALREYADTAGVQWVEDPSNVQLDRDRNYLRHEVLPELRQRWPDVDEALLSALTDRQRADRALLAAMNADGNRICLERLPKQPGAAVEALRIWLASRGERLPARVALQDFVAQLAAPHDRQPALAIGSASLRRYGKHVYHVAPSPVLAETYPLPLPGFLRLPHGELTVAVAGAAGDNLGAAATVEFVGNHPGACIVVSGHRRRVRELLHAAHVPPWRRVSYPLVIDADGVVAVPGIAHRDSARRADLESDLESEVGPVYVCNWSETEELH